MLARGAGTAPGLGPVPFHLGRPPSCSLSKAKRPAPPAPKPVFRGTPGGNRLWAPGARLPPPRPSTQVCSLPSCPSLRQSSHPSTGSTAHTLRPSLCQHKHHVSMAGPHSERQGVTPRQPGPPHQRRSLRPCRASHMPSGVDRDEGSAKVERARLGATLPHPLPPWPEQQLLTFGSGQAPAGLCLRRLSRFHLLPGFTGTRPELVRARRPQVWLRLPVLPDFRWPHSSRLPLSFLRFPAGAELAPWVLHAPNPHLSP